MSLTEVELCSGDEIVAFTERQDFFRLVLNARDLPSDELLAAAVRSAGWQRSAGKREEFLITCGRRMASLLSHDLTRLAHVLELIRP
jgi:hypothetical protein